MTGASIFKLERTVSQSRDSIASSASDLTKDKATRREFHRNQMTSPVLFPSPKDRRLTPSASLDPSWDWIEVSPAELISPRVIPTFLIIGSLKFSIAAGISLGRTMRRIA